MSDSLDRRVSQPGALPLDPAGGDDPPQAPTIIKKLLKKPEIVVGEHVIHGGDKVVKRFQAETGTVADNLGDRRVDPPI